MAGPGTLVVALQLWTVIKKHSASGKVVRLRMKRRIAPPLVTVQRKFGRIGGPEDYRTHGWRGKGRELLSSKKDQGAENSALVSKMFAFFSSE